MGIFRSFFAERLIFYLIIYPRIIKYKILSNCKFVIGKPILKGPLLIKGKGKIIFGKNVNFGVMDSPFYFSGYSYLEARNPTSSIKFGDNVYINNCMSIVAEGCEIAIGSNVLIGTNLNIFDSDFHALKADSRFTGQPKMQSVQLMDNVFIGSNVSIMKGVTIGKNSVIASGSIVTKPIPENVIAGGNPCIVLKHL